MKKVSAGILAVASMLYATDAYAVKNTFYIGTDAVYDFNSVSGGPTFLTQNPTISQEVEYPKNLPSAVLNAGYNFSEKLGVEAYYQMSGTKKHNTYGIYSTNAELKSETSYESYGLDFIAYIKSTDKVDWLLSAGLGQYEFETKFKYMNGGTPVKIYTAKEDCIAPRLGAGFQINFDDYISFRAMYRYVFVDIPGIDKIQEVLVGVRIGFEPFYWN